MTFKHYSTNKHYFHIILSLVIFCSCEKSVQDATTDTIPPQALILYPTDGEVVFGEIMIQARATDNEEIAYVEFYLNQQKTFMDSIANSNGFYTYRWNTEQLIESSDSLIHKYEEDQYHYLSIIAYDNSGNNFATAPIRSRIDNIDNEDPHAFILYPFQGQSISGNTNITVIASDNDSITSVNFYIDDRLEAIRPSTTLITELDQFGNETYFHAYLYTWNTELVNDGYHSIRVTVFDLNNNSSIIPPIGVTVNNGVVYDPIPPTGTIVSPPAGLTLNGTVPIIVNANDNVAIGGVAFSINGEYMETISISPYAYLWNTLMVAEDTQHTISAIVIDSVGNETPLNPISVFVNNTIDPDITPPTASIFYPAAGQTISGTVNIEAHSTDNSGVAYVIFFIDGNEEHIDNEAPFNYSWDSELVSEDSEHTIAIASCDNFGNCSLAQPITIIVNNFDNIQPSGHILNPFPGQILEGNVEIQFSAYDNENIKNVIPTINGNAIDTITTFPYTSIWNTTLETEDAYHVIGGVISDSSDNLFYVLPIVVFIDNYINDISPPTGTISNPISGQTVGDTVQFTVLAQDNYGISNVEFYINGNNVYNDTEYPYQYPWDTSVESNNTEYTLSARVSDNANHTILLQPILVIVINE